MDEEKVYYTIILRHDTSTNWMMNNPILALSEYGVEDDTHRVKRGDGQSNWADLPYEHFGLEYLVTFENLIGDVADNENLKTALDSKINNNIFSENANGVIENIILTDEEGTLAKITRVTKDVVLGSTRLAYLKVISRDNSIQGIYSIDDEGARVLNLQAYSHINDYEVGKTYHINELCYYDNRLYRAVHEEFVAEESFTKAHWVLLASLHSNDIKYNHLISGLEAENVKEAIDELADLDSQKVKKTSRENKVYGTNEFGEQYLYNKDDLRKVDTVNHKQADLNKNVQVDASDINYTDTDPSKGTVRQVLDSKVDKTVAGAGAKIVRDVQFDYDVTTGHIILREDKFSLEDGASATEQREIDVVSEQELAGEVQTLNNRIDDEVSTLNTRIDTEVDTINERVDTEVQTLNNRIDNEVETLNTTITTKETAIYNKIQDEHDEINERVDQEVSDLNDRIDDEVNTLNTTINNKETALQAQITHNVEEINRVETESQERDTTLNTRIDTEVQTLNNRIDTEVSDLNDRIDTEVATLNNTINTKEIAMDNKKINKSIAPGLVSEIIAATESNEPTLKITTKNTTTETPTVSHLHFKGQGQILTRFQDADHIVIDSTNIDNKNNQQDTRLTNAETRISANEDNITTLQTHDASHDTTLALHAQQIADNTHDIQDLQADMTDANYDIGRLQTQNATQETHLTNLDELVQANADDITIANQNISRNLQSITELQANKANKTFANLTNNKVVGTLNTQELQNNEIIKLGIKSIDPSTETASDSILKVISSDNTIIATRDRDTGVIDLKANLDTDVNYFVTTEILNTTIPSQNIIPLNTLTPTDKINVEVHDIISDPEGTWARVESINNVTETCVAVTFKKHAQAVWGTIKGTLSDQQDLQGILTSLDNDKVDKTTTGAQIYGTDNQGNQITYNLSSFGVVDTVNNIQADANKNVQLDASNINIDDEAETKQTVKDAIVNIKQPFIISADFLALTEESTSQEIFNIFGGEDVIEKLIKNVYEGNIILTRMYDSYGFDGFFQEFKPITIELNHKPGSTFDLDTYTQISFTIYADTYFYLYTLYFEYDRKNHNIDLYKMREYPKIYSAPISDEIAKITPESTQYKIEAAIRLYNPYDNDAFASQLNYEIRVEGDGAGFPSKIIYFKPNKLALEEDDNKHLLGEICLITYWNDNIQRYDNNPKIKKFSIKYNETNSQYIIENYEEINLSQIEANRTAIETLQSIIPNLITDLQTQISTYTQNTSYTAIGTYTTQKYVTFENAAGVVLMAKVLKGFTSDNTESTVYESFIKDVEDGNLKLVGIPEQV